MGSIHVVHLNSKIPIKHWGGDLSCAATPKIGYIGDGDGSVGYTRQPSFGFVKLQDPPTYMY